jgi:hypothetical protein
MLFADFQPKLQPAHKSGRPIVAPADLRTEGARSRGRLAAERKTGHVVDTLTDSAPLLPSVGRAADWFPFSENEIGFASVSFSSSSVCSRSRAKSDSPNCLAIAMTVAADSRMRSADDGSGGRILDDLVEVVESWHLEMDS